MENYDLAIIGGVGDYDLLLAEYLSKKGLECIVFRNLVKRKSSLNYNFSSFHTHFKIENVYYFRHPFDFLKSAKKSKLIISLTGGLIGALRYLWFLRRILFLPPVFNITTGSDITELTESRSWHGSLYRQYLKFAKINWCPNYPHAMKNILKLKIQNVIFMKYPYNLGQFDKENNSDRLNNRIIHFFHPTHLDWKVNDPGIMRNSSKGNDRFLKAFVRALKNGFPGSCVILDRGPDKEEAKKIISDAGCKEYFIWKSDLTRDELFQEYKKADIVVDQFDVGGLGAVAVEAMSCGKPIMTYLQGNCLKVLYYEPPPVLNCHTEDEIYEQITKCRDRSFLVDIGKRARDWAYKYHFGENCLDQFIFYYTLETGHQIMDYGWEKNLYIEG